jgi:membrane protein
MPSGIADDGSPPQPAGAHRRGRDADRPTEIPPTGWKDVLVRVRVEAKDDGVTLMSAGVAFYALLALVPGLVALISIYGLLAEPSDVKEQVTSTLSAAPAEVRELVTAQLEAIVASAGGDAVVGAVIGLVLALWSASSGVGHLVEAINRTYDEKETRGFLRLKIISLALTVGSVLFIVVAFAIVALLPALLAKTGLGASGRIAVGLLRWVLLLGGMTLGLAVLYRYGPDRDDARWQWVSPGAIVASVMWVLGSVVFSVYTANFARYNETYGSLGAVVVLLLWLFLTALAVIVGAEINCELERQTVRDSTEGPAEPLGSRNAIAADTVGGTAEEVKLREQRARDTKRSRA